MTEKTNVATADVYHASKFLGNTFLRNYIADNQLTTDKELAEAKEMYKNELTLKIEFDFSNVTVEEMCRQLVSTTSYAKMLYNNELVMLNEDQCRELCAKGVYKCNIREMLDTRKTKTADPEARLGKNVKDMEKKGMTTEQIRAALERQLENYK